MKISTIASAILIAGIPYVSAIADQSPISTGLTQSSKNKQIKNTTKDEVQPLYGDKLWNQPPHDVNNAIVNYDATDDIYDAFTVDDFQILPGTKWSVTSFFEPLVITNGAYDPSTVVHVKIYRDNGTGVPTSGDPRLETPLWSTSASISDTSQITLTPTPLTFTADSQIEFTPTEPPVLTCGNYWLSMYTENTVVNQRTYIRYSYSDNLNNHKWINPGGGYGSGTEWIDTSSQLDIGGNGMAFTLSGASMSSAMPHLTTDLTGNGTNDLLWHNSITGEVRIMEMNCMSPRWTETIMTTAGSQLPKGIADFTGDGKVDILVQDMYTGRIVIWEMDGLNKTDEVEVVASANLNLQIAGLGDFDQDGDPDIAMINTNSGNLSIWVMDGPSRVSSVTVLTGTNLNLLPRGAGDMDSDGIPDILLRNNNTGNVRIWTMNSNFTRKSNVVVTNSSNTNLELRGVTDINGDGDTDVLNYNTNTGRLRAWLMDGNMGIMENAEVTINNDLNWSVRN